MAWCCAPPATNGALIEVVPMDLDKEVAIKAPLSAAASKRPGDKLNGARSYPNIPPAIPEAPDHFDKYDGLLHEPCWDQEKTWMPDDRANGSFDANNTTKEERLKNLLASFRPKVADGIRLDVVDSSTRLFSQCIFKMDMSTHIIHLMYAFGEESQYSFQDVSAIFKGSEFARKMPKLEHLSSKCIGIEFQSEYGSPLEPTCLHFEDSGSRNDFYACLKIMQMTSANLGPSMVARR